MEDTSLEFYHDDHHHRFKNVDQRDIPAMNYVREVEQRDEFEDIEERKRGGNEMEELVLLLH